MADTVAMSVSEGEACADGDEDDDDDVPHQANAGRPFCNGSRFCALDDVA